MPRVLTNSTGLAYCRETALGVASTEWFRLEPNSISNLGSTITTVARDPISEDRQRRKGTTTDLDSGAEIEVDTTLSSVQDFLAPVVFVVPINEDVSQLGLASAAASGGDYTLGDALTSEQAGKLPTSALIWVTGFTQDANNGLKLVDANTTAGTTVTVSDTLVDESSPFRRARLSIAGYRVPAATTVTATWNGTTSQLTVNSTGLGTTLEAMGLFPGMLVHFGSVTDIGESIQNGWTTTAFGYAYVVSVAADAIVFDKVSTALQANQTDPGDLDIVFGQLARNVPVSDPAFLEQSIQLEAQYPNLGSGAPGNSDTAYEYSVGNLVNTIALSLPLTDKSVMTVALIGTDTEEAGTTRKAGGDAAQATGTLTLTGNVSNNDTVTIGSITYTFQTVLVDAANNVLIGASASDSIDNLVAAVVAGAGAGTNYGTGTVANNLATAAAGAGDTMVVTAIVTGPVGNTVATTETSATASFGAATLSGGTFGAQLPTQTAAFNTTADFARLRIADVDESGLTTDFKSATLNFNNNVSPEKVLGRLGARFMNYGNFEVSVEAQVLFTDVDVRNRIRENTTVSMDFILRNDDGVVGVNIPSATLSGGNRDFPVNETVLINLTVDSFADPTLNTSVGISIIPVPLPPTPPGTI